VENKNIIKLDLPEKEILCGICKTPILGKKDGKAYPLNCTKCNQWIHSSCAVKRGLLRTLCCPKCKESIEGTAVLFCPSCQITAGHLRGPNYPKECPRCKSSYWLLPVKEIGGKESLFMFLGYLIAMFIAVFATAPFREGPLYTWGIFCQIIFWASAVLFGLLCGPFIIVAIGTAMMYLLSGFSSTPSPQADVEKEILGSPTSEIVPAWEAREFLKQNFRQRMIIYYLTTIRKAPVAIFAIVAVLLLMAFFGNLSRGCS